MFWQVHNNHCMLDRSRGVLQVTHSDYAYGCGTGTALPPNILFSHFLFLPFFRIPPEHNNQGMLEGVFHSLPSLAI